MARARFAFAILGVSLLILAFPASAVVPPIRQPSWVELNADQQRILAPLAAEWDKLESYRRKKWLGIAKRYPSMSPEEQARIQRRMASWVKMTPSERNQARDKYLALQKASPEQKEALRQRWQEYKALPDTEKNRLKAEARSSSNPKAPAGRYPQGTSPPKSAAPSPPSQTTAAPAN